MIFPLYAFFGTCKVKKEDNENKENINKINDFDWLKDYFLTHYPKVKIQ